MTVFTAYPMLLLRTEQKDDMLESCSFCQSLKIGYSCLNSCMNMSRED